MGKSLLLIIGTAIIVITLIKGRQRAKKRAMSKSPFTVNTPYKVHNTTQTKIHEELDQLVVDIQEISQKCIAKLDTKMRLMNEMLKELDQKQESIRSLLDQMEKSQQKPQIPSQEPAPTPPSEESTPKLKSKNPLHQSIYDRIDIGQNADDISRELDMDRGEVDLILGLRNMNNND